ncbi:hypothetical protein QCA50_019637 [Cerrena zonata]|uniref:26S proteasome regulatory subunit Rpn6 N-terminal domain-containing protein n=1 Tax=Cerrena zonata TaxID=2478898 RepID=A0AAW0FEZ4_9APHY
MSEPSPILEEARVASSKGNFQVAETKYKSIIATRPSEDQDDTKSNNKLLQEQEAAIIELGKIYQGEGQPQDLAQLITDSRSVLGNFAKLKTAKIVRTLIEDFDTIPNVVDLQIQAIKESIEWAVAIIDLTELDKN